SVSAEFDLHSIDGTIFIALSPKLGTPARPVKKPQFFATGGGGAHVVARSFKGNIRLVVRD
ncbi:MAG TPA: hypothetical protein VJK71_07285, partial [Gemmatimonadales bacterium]|nr:hypothetical protein [Gemmatimonadales bacterium]